MAHIPQGIDVDATVAPSVDVDSLETHTMATMQWRLSVALRHQSWPGLMMNGSSSRWNKSARNRNVRPHTTC